MTFLLTIIFVCFLLGKSGLWLLAVVNHKTKIHIFITGLQTQKLTFKFATEHITPGICQGTRRVPSTCVFWAFRPSQGANTSTSNIDELLTGGLHHQVCVWGGSVPHMAPRRPPKIRGSLAVQDDQLGTLDIIFSYSQISWSWKVGNFPRRSKASPFGG